MKMKTTVIQSKARSGDADIDEIILEWSKSGVLDSAATDAIQASHQQGRAVTIIEDGIVYRFMPDGTRQELRRLNRQRTTRFTSGIAYIR